MYKIPIIMCILLLMMPVECQSLPGGESITVIGPDFRSSSGQPPVYNYPRGAVGMGDPSNYVVPAVKVKPSPKPPDGNKSSSLIGGGTQPAMVFTMSSDVSGTGRFVQRSFVDGEGYDDKTYQLMSARYGNLTQSREVSFIKERVDGSLGSDAANYTLARIEIQDTMRFFGLSYTDLTKLKNDRDRVQEDTRTGAISRTTSYRSQSLDLYLEGETYKHLMNNYLVYNIDTRLVGSTNLHAVTNTTEIFESYLGRIAIKRSIGNHLMFNGTAADAGGLECCAQVWPEGSPGMQIVSTRD